MVSAVNIVVDPATLGVLVVDSHPLLREGIRRVLERAADVAVVAEASDAEQGLALCEREDCRLVLLCLSLPDRDGLDALGDIQKKRGDLPVIVFTDREDHQLGARALRAGARGVLSKVSPPEDLLTAIRRVRRGERYMSQPLHEVILHSWQRPGERLPHQELSDREYQVLCLIAAGRTLRDMAEHLAISSNTVSTYRKRILSKMGVRTNAELMRYALAHQLVT